MICEACLFDLCDDCTNENPDGAVCACECNMGNFGGIGYDDAEETS